MRWRLLSFALLASLFRSPAVAQPLAPSAKWVVDFGDAHCIAAREYKTTGNTYSLILRPSPIGDVYEVLVVRKGSGPEYAEELDATVAFDGRTTKTFMLSYGLIKPELRHFDIYHLSKAEVEGARNASIVTFDREHSPPLSFTLASMPALLDNLAACNEGLKRYWNYGGEKTGAIATPAKTNLLGIFNDDDFPSEGMQRHQEGQGKFLLLINEAGKVANCTIVETTGFPIFDAKSCAIIIERGKFKPALDASGKPVRSMVVTPPITYRY